MVFDHLNIARALLLLGLFTLAAKLQPHAQAAAAEVTRPANAAGEFDAGIAAFDEFDFERAATLFARAESLGGISADSLYYRTRLAALRSEPAAALQLANSCVQRFPRASRCQEALAEANITAVLSGGNAISSLSQARAAKSAWERALALDPRNSRAGLLLLRYCRQAPWVAGGSERQARDLQAALTKVSAAAGHQARALNLLADEQFDAALAAFNAAIAADPTDRDPRISAAFALIVAKRWPAAARAAEELLQRYPKFIDPWLMLATAHHEGRLDPARGIVAARTFIAAAGHRAKPQRAQAQALLGALLERSGDKSAARAAYTQALALHDENPLAESGLARVRAGSG